MKQQLFIQGRQCTVFQNGEHPRMLLVQPVDGHDLEELDMELEEIISKVAAPFRFIAIHIDRWFDELAPWPAPPVFGKTPFGNGARVTLELLQKIVADESCRLSSPDDRSMKVILGGYSLAGLFALWTGYQQGQPFDAVVAASPSVWYQGWLDFATANNPQIKACYLSLGDREERSRTPILTTIGTAIRRQQQLLESAHVINVLEWNSGNHFQDNGKRTAKGFVWAMNAVLPAL